MKLPWSNPSEKSSPPLVALSQLPIAAWGKTDPATLVRDGYSGNAVVYRCVRMIAEAAASITFQASDEHVQSMMLEPSADDAGQTLFERLYTDIQITGNAWLEAVTLPDQAEPRALFSLRPDTVRVHKDKVGQISGYGVKLKRGERIIGRDPDGWSPVLHIKLYHPGDSTYGLSPLSAARKSLDVHNGAAGCRSILGSARFKRCAGAPDRRPAVSQTTPRQYADPLFAAGFGDRIGGG